MKYIVKRDDENTRQEDKNRYETKTRKQETNKVRNEHMKVQYRRCEDKMAKREEN